MTYIRLRDFKWFNFDMTQEERIIKMQAWLKDQRRITLGEICSLFSISRDSARRDLVKLTQFSGVQRIRGGAMYLPVTPDVQPVVSRAVSDEKREIAKKAASLVEENDSIILDAGSTLSVMAGYLNVPVTVITNSLDSLVVLSAASDIVVHCLGGQFNTLHRAIWGDSAVQQLARYRTNKAFIGVCALSTRGLSTSSEAEAATKRSMIEQAERVILVCQASKFGLQHVFHVAGLESVDVIITDRMPSEAMQQALDAHNVQLIITSS
ncbi:DeoR/GlpR family DNA-binding transcription regulator [Vibrio profundum]|uniref:DeoR/GlpR family DNA-binding transcription regulator n=1 Tax=Vibrio profundum TaxID=2910247 RepID=UPI003D0DF138